jgi:hypothetical protein
MFAIMLVHSGLKHLPETVSQNPHSVFLVGKLSLQRQAVGENLLAHAAHAAGDYYFKVNRSNLPLNFHRTSVVLA